MMRWCETGWLDLLTEEGNAPEMLVMYDDLDSEACKICWRIGKHEHLIKQTETHEEMICFLKESAELYHSDMGTQMRMLAHYMEEEAEVIQEYERQLAKELEDFRLIKLLEDEVCQMCSYIGTKWCTKECDKYKDYMNRGNDVDLRVDDEECQGCPFRFSGRCNGDCSELDTSEAHGKLTPEMKAMLEEMEALDAQVRATPVPETEGAEFIRA